VNHLPFSPAAERNQQPILERLQALLPERGSALEIASGTGQHAVAFAQQLPGWTWQPTEADAALLKAIDARVQMEGLSTQVRPALGLDVFARAWPIQRERQPEAFDLIFCANLLHIAPWPVCGGLMQGAAIHLAPGGVLVTYGPYLEHGVPTSPGNQAFDASLRASNPAWGLRQLDDVVEQAEQAGLVLRARHAMPANNLLLVWTREPAGQ
jgi:SAM-dependent methyltransferase